MNEFQQFIEGEIKTKFNNKSIVLWFDKDNNFCSVFDELVLDVNKIKFEGSFLKIKFKIYEEDPSFQKKWLIYLPFEEDNSDWLRDIIVLSKIYNDSFETIFKNMGYELTQENRVFIKKNARNIIENPSNYSDCLKKHKGNDDIIIKEKFFANIFDSATFDIKTVLLKFINYFEEYSSKLQKNEREFIELICSILGSKNVYGSSLKELQTNIIRTAFFSEFYFKKKDKKNFKFNNLLPEQSKIQLFSEIIGQWQRDTEYKSFFKKQSEEIETNYSNLVVDIVDHLDIIEVTAFKKIDDYIFEKIIQKFEKDKSEISKIIQESEIISDAIAKRKQLFWAKENPNNQWILLERALYVILNAEKAIKDLSPLCTNEEIIKNYLDKYWRIDSDYRIFSELLVENRHKIDDILFLVEKYYETYLEKINRAFSENLISSNSWNNNVLSQSSFWEDIINNLKKERKTVVIIVDALRYELAKELESKLNILNFDIQLIPMISLLPSITEVGMAAILPHEKIYFQDIKDQFNVKLDDLIIRDKNDRKKIIKKHLGVDTLFLNLPEVLDMHKQEIEKKIRNKDIIFIFSQDIDLLGENVSQVSLSLFSRVLKELNSTILRFQQAGVSKFIITTDHGFLFMKGCKEEDKIDIQESDILLKSRRFAIGNNFNNPSVIKIDPIKENVISDLEMIFPSGISCFRAPGGDRFLHGGISLQEIILPCMIVESTADSRKEKINVKIDCPEKVKNSIFRITIRPVYSSLQFRSRNIQIKTLKDNVEVAETSNFEIEENPISTIIILKPTIKSGRILIRVADLDTKEILSEKEIELDIIYVDEII